MVTYSTMGECKLHLEGDHQVDRVPDSPDESLAQVPREQDLWPF